MEHDIDPRAYGIAAFSILEALAPKLVESGLISREELLAILDRIARAESSRGVASDSDVDSGAARLAGKLASMFRRKDKG